MRVAVAGVVSAKLNALRVMVATKGDIPQNVNFAIKATIATIATNFLETRGVPVESGPLGAPLDPADVADKAKAISVFITCR